MRWIFIQTIIWNFLFNAWELNEHKLSANNFIYKCSKIYQTIKRNTCLFYRIEMNFTGFDEIAISRAMLFRLDYLRLCQHKGIEDCLHSTTVAVIFNCLPSFKKVKILCYFNCILQALEIGNVQVIYKKSKKNRTKNEILSSIIIIGYFFNETVNNIIETTSIHCIPHTWWM